MILLDKYVKFLVKNDITEKQFLVMYLAYSKRKDLVAIYKDRFNVQGKLLSPKDEEVLVNKGFLQYLPNGATSLTKKFINLFVDKDLATEEIFEIYPVSTNKDGIAIPLKAMDRSVFANLYITAIMGSIEEHEEVKQDIEYAIKQGLLNIGIEKFVKSKYWLGIRKQRLENKEVLQTKTAIDKEF